MLTQCTGTGLTGDLSTILQYSQHSYGVYCTPEKPPPNFWIGTGTLTNKEGM